MVVPAEQVVLQILQEDPAQQVKEILEVLVTTHLEDPAVVAVVPEHQVEMLQLTVVLHLPVVPVLHGLMA